MLKKTIKFVDYDGNEREEDFFFNLTQAELTTMQMSEVGGLEKKLENIIKAQDAPRIMEMFRDIIRRSYGVKSPDGRRFIKSAEISDEFEQTEAYSILFMELCTDAEAASAFVNGILPKNLAEEVKKNTPKPKKASAE